MARQVIVLALVFAIVGFASAQLTNHPQASGAAAAPAANAPQAKASADAPAANASQAKASADAPSSSPSNAPAAGPTAEPGKMPDIAMPGPVGSLEKMADAPSNSGSTVFPASAILAGVAVAGFFY